ncbi:hypothetical protein R6Q59_030598 [Mikania micrantha]
MISTGENSRPAAKLQIEQGFGELMFSGGVVVVPILDISAIELSKKDWMFSGQGSEFEAGHGDLNGVLRKLFRVSMEDSGEEDMPEKAMTLQLLIDRALMASAGVRQLAA